MLDIKGLVDELVALRKANGLSQRAMAKKLGVSYTTVQDIEKYIRGLWIEDVDRWLEACNLTLARFFAQRASKAERALAEKDRELMDLFHGAIKVSDYRAILKPILEAYSNALKQFDRNEQ